METLGATPTPASDNDVDETSLYLTLALSILGLIWAITSYILSSKWFCCEETLWEKITGCCKKKSTACQEEDDTRSVLCSSSATVNVITALHLLGKPVLITVNIIYLVLTGLPERGGDIDILGLNSTNPKTATGLKIAQFISFICADYEIGTVVVIPLLSGCLWLKCMKRNLDEGNCQPYLEFMRFGDLAVTFLLAPFANVNLFVLGRAWYVVIGVRLAFYAVTFAAGVIAGIRFILSFCCCVLFECACNNKAVEIRNWNHLILNVASTRTACSGTATSGST